MIPMVLSTGSSASTTKGLAIVNIGGLTAGILVALFILPVYYAIMNGKKERKVLDIYLNGCNIELTEYDFRLLIFNC